eukprot:c2428_g1_i1.p1 GENE.c2428_g1_i1~~c2428_g1_i1.p1  ORF type:complete len:405 (-),score=111.73 c2428_g1_i1:43-1257(-)
MVWSLVVLLTLGNEHHHRYIAAMRKEYSLNIPELVTHKHSDAVVLPQTIAFIQETSQSNSTLFEAMGVKMFCESGIHLELRRKISKDISSLHSQQSIARSVSNTVAFFVDEFIDPFVEIISFLIINPLIEAMRDVLPWYLVGPITSIFAGTAPKPVIGSIDAMLGMYMPPLIAIGITKKLVKGLTLVLTASIVSIIERARTGNSNAVSAGDGGGVQIVLQKEISRRMGVDITNHLMETVPRAADRALAHTLSTSLTTSVQLYYYCTYCYWFGDYCKLCFYLPDYTWKESQWWQKQRQERLADRHYAETLEKDVTNAVASADKPLSPITLPESTPQGYVQKMNNEITKERRQERLARTSAQLHNGYARRQLGPRIQAVDGMQNMLPEVHSDSTVETSDVEANDNR